MAAALTSRKSGHRWLALVRMADGRTFEQWVSAGITRVRVPVMGEGVNEYVWDGIERDDQGRRVYR
jgi:hypothetical protein